MGDGDLPAFDASSLADPPPHLPVGERKKRGRPKGSKNKASAKADDKKLTDAQLKKAVEEALVFPAIPSMMFYPTAQGKQYLATHFTMAGPWGAERLVTASKTSPALRAQLEKIAQGSVAAMILSFIGVYLGAPVLFVLGQGQMAEGLTMSTQVDEAALSQMMGSMLANAAARMEDDAGVQSQPPSHPQGAAGEGGAAEPADWVESQSESDPPPAFS